MATAADVLDNPIAQEDVVIVPETQEDVVIVPETGFFPNALAETDLQLVESLRPEPAEVEKDIEEQTSPHSDAKGECHADLRENDDVEDVCQHSENHSVLTSRDPKPQAHDFMGEPDREPQRNKRGTRYHKKSKTEGGDYRCMALTGVVVLLVMVAAVIWCPPLGKAPNNKDGNHHADGPHKKSIVDPKPDDQTSEKSPSISQEDQALAEKVPEAEYWQEDYQVGRVLLARNWETATGPYNWAIIEDIDEAGLYTVRWLEKSGESHKKHKKEFKLMWLRPEVIEEMKTTIGKNVQEKCRELAKAEMKKTGAGHDRTLEAMYTLKSLGWEKCANEVYYHIDLSYAKESAEAIGPANRNLIKELWVTSTDYVKTITRTVVTDMKSKMGKEIDEKQISLTKLYKVKQGKTLKPSRKVVWDEDHTNKKVKNGIVTKSDDPDQRNYAIEVAYELPLMEKAMDYGKKAFGMYQKAKPFFDMYQKNKAKPNGSAANTMAIAAGIVVVLFAFRRCRNRRSSSSSPAALQLPMLAPCSNTEVVVLF